MKLKENYLRILAVLRKIENKYFHFVIKELNKEKETKIDLKDIYIFVEKNPIENYNISKLLKTADYYDFLKSLKNTPKLQKVVSNILENKRKEYELKIQKINSPEEYFDSLPEVDIDQLIESISKGWVINDVDVYGNPKDIESDEMYSGTFIEEPIATAKINGKYLSKIIDQVSMGKLSSTSKGIRLRKVVIYGEVDLNFIKLNVPLSFQGCYFRNWISADHLEVPMLVFEHCKCLENSSAIYKNWAFNGSNVKVHSILRFLYCKDLEQIFLPYAEIGTFILESPTVDSCKDMRTEFSSIKIRDLYIPDQNTDNNFYVEFDRGLSVDRLSGKYEDILIWLKNSQKDGAVWDIFSDALENAGNPEKAIDLRIAFKKYENSKEFKGKKRNPIARLFVWLSLDCTVKFFHKPLRAIYFLVFNFFITWILSFVFFSSFLASPLVNEIFTKVWIHDSFSLLAWSFMHAIDLTFYPLNLGQVDSLWTSNIYLALIFSLIKATSIIYLGLFLGGTTNLINKRSSTK